MLSADRESRLVEDWHDRLAKNWRNAVDDVAAAARAAGRDASAVRIVAVSKYVDLEMTGALVDCGCLELGEARPQRLVEKAVALGGRPNVRWHLIGSLQRNKARRVIRVADTIHSIDSYELLKQLDRIAGEEGKRIEGLLEVNLSGDTAKHGFSPAELMETDETLGQLRQLRLVGLMGMSGLDADAATTRRQFASLRELAERLSARCGVALPELSMGMSGDFVEAVKEGSTMVRIGSRLFEGLWLDAQR